MLIIIVADYHKSLTIIIIIDSVNHYCSLIANMTFGAFRDVWHSLAVVAVVFVGVLIMQRSDHDKYIGRGGYMGRGNAVQPPVGRHCGVAEFVDQRKNFKKGFGVIYTESNERAESSQES